VDIHGKKVLVLGGPGLVGMAVCRELLSRGPREIQIHSLREQESLGARDELAVEAGATALSVSWGDIFGMIGDHPRLAEIRAQVEGLSDGDLPAFRLYDLLTGSKPEIVIDCVNTATGIAYRDLFRSAEAMLRDLERRDPDDPAADRARVENLLESLYMPRMIRHIQVMYRGMVDAHTRAYVKVGTSGTGGMGLNIPYTHSEEKPSRVLLSKSAIAGAHSMLLFLMARTPGAPITKEIKPAAAIAWKKIGYGPIRRRGVPIHRVETKPRPLGPTFSSHDETAARVRDEVLESVYIDTGENGIFSLEEFAMLTTAEQMEFVTPEEIAEYLIYEIEGRNTGHDIVNALDNAVLGPTYRAGLLRHWAMERMVELERDHDTRSVAFEMLGPPRNSKLLFEAHLLRRTFKTMREVQDATPEEVRDRLDALIREDPDQANDIVAIGIPILLDSGEILRGQEVLVPHEAKEVEVTPERREAWVHDGWVDLRLANCAKWISRCDSILTELDGIPDDDTSSRHLRNRRFWHDGAVIQPGKIVGWVLSAEEHGGRIKR
jgi:NAD(P)-dependent dehydrogenase (short-subunit alcohol dehydrogenase family)